MRNRKTPASSRHSTSSSPVVSQKVLKSATAPGSVALTSRISPPATPFIALRARSTGSGHLRPVASREVTDKPAIPLFEGVAGIGRAHDSTPVTNTQLVYRLQLAKQKNS